MIVIYRNGERVLITGWRAWLMTAVGVLLVALAVVMVATLLLGFALTIGTILLFAVPLAVVLGLIARLVMPRA